MDPAASLSDAEMVAKAAAGDGIAFRRLVVKYQGFAYALSFKLTGNAAEAEDIVQETFVRVWKNLQKYRKEVKLRTWLYTITTNLCLDYLKSSRGREYKLHVSMRDSLPLAARETPETMMLNRELGEVVAKMADRLTPKQRAVFVLRDLEELSIEEIGEVLSMRANNVKSNLYYARMKIADLTRQYYKEHE